MYARFSAGVRFSKPPLRRLDLHRLRSSAAPAVPVVNRRAKHGMYTKAALEERQALRSLIREMEGSLREIEDG